MPILVKWNLLFYEYENSLPNIIINQHVIGVIQDSCETALNSAGDALFSATAEYHDRMKRGEPVNYLGEFAK